MITTLEDFIREYTKIKEMGWIRTIVPVLPALEKRWKICWVLQKTISTDPTLEITSLNLAELTRRVC